jgi:hypothetical protein
MIGISLGPPEMLGKYCLIRNQATLRVVWLFVLYLTLVVPDELTPQNSVPWAEKLQDFYRAVEGIRLHWTCWLLIGGLTFGIRDLGCLGRNSGAPVLGSLFTEGNKERQEWAAGDL